MVYSNLERALSKSAYTLQTLLKQSVPVDTGNLRDSIIVEADHEGWRIKYFIQIAPYWKWIARGPERRWKEPVPVPEVLTLSPTIAVKRYGSINAAIEAIRAELNQAFLKDITETFDTF